MPPLPRWLSLGSRFARARKRVELRLSRPKCHDLVIFDDVFPQPLSAFRICEFTAYLRQFQDTTVYSTGGSFPLLGETRCLAEVIAGFESLHPELRGRVYPFEATRRLKARVAYTVFVANTARFAEAAEHSGAAVAFTLYPGGGFYLDRKASDEMLRRIMGARSFRKVIVTQKVTRDYLLDRSLCAPEQIEFIYGGVFPHYSSAASAKVRFAESKDSFDVCFVAHKYMPGGYDKGYDVFVEVVRRLANAYPRMRFHVVGPFTPDDGNVSDQRRQVTFYGTRDGSFFGEFYRRMDMILSPNAPFLLAPGAFDGFPTGACVEAGLCGVAVVATDCLKQNIAFQDGRDIIIVPRNVDAIIDRIEFFYRNPTQLQTLADSGRKSFEKVFAYSAQIEPRIQLLEALLRV